MSPRQDECKKRVIPRSTRKELWKSYITRIGENIGSPNGWEMRTEYDNLCRQSACVDQEAHVWIKSTTVVSGAGRIISGWIADRRTNALVVSMANIPDFSLTMAPQTSKASPHWLD